MHSKKENLRTKKERKFESKISQAIKKYNLINEGDRIMIGVSGGIDSMSLLTTLNLRKNYFKENFEIVAIHIEVDNVPYSINKQYIADFCKQNDINFIVEKIHIDFEKDPSKSKCFICSWHRRKRLFELTAEHNCNKLALGHHLDDAIETLIINMCYHGCISSMPASLKMFKGKIELIRPLMLLTKNEIIAFAKQMNFPQENSSCPYEDKTKRSQAAEIISEMEKRFKPARKGIFNSMSKIHKDYLPVETGKNPIIEGLNLPHSNNKS